MYSRLYNRIYFARNLFCRLHQHLRPFRREGVSHAASSEGYRPSRRLMPDRARRKISSDILELPHARATESVPTISALIDRARSDTRTCPSFFRWRAIAASDRDNSVLSVSTAAGERLGIVAKRRGSGHPVVMASRCRFERYQSM